MCSKFVRERTKTACVNAQIGKEKIVTCFDMCTKSIYLLIILTRYRSQQNIHVT